ncbi:hypothetical protein N7516_009882 [Penicillium verrucosum]|uniref:uncharacterized protein n=1 Tax=Penicillium verrucosum TaxID=60171 RepID=UPI0025450FAF|nr:uncharacterized protein N7516_009882 [Penicillium verrucosum]KAJ5922179.1 hypothetical protein N7516_009882 [Penicillium verrucosum]
MVHSSDFEEYLRLQQIFQPSSEKHNSHAETSAMQPPPPLPSADWPPHNSSVSHASTFLGPNWTMPTQTPASAAGHIPASSTNWPLCGPSMSHASRSLHPGRTMYTAVGHPAADNFYQSNMQLSPTMQYRDTEVGAEDHLSQGQTTTHTWFSTPRPSTQELSPPNQQSGAANVESTSVHGEPQQQE